MDTMLGHNLRDPLDAEIAATLALFKSDFDERGPEIARCQVTNDDEAGRATALAGIIADIADAAEKKRVEMKDPYLKGGKKIDASFGILTDALKVAKMRVVGMIQGYRDELKRKAETERLRLEVEARAKEEAARAAAAAGNLVQAAKLEQQAENASASALVAAVAPTQPIRSAYGQTASGRKEWEFAVTDRKLLPASILQHPKVHEAQDAVIRALVRGGTREIAGVRIYSVDKLVVRR